MSKLISGKEALIALANGEDVEYQVVEGRNVWNRLYTMSVNLILADNFKFRLKPRTTTINGIEVPAPFEPEVGDSIYFIDPTKESGWSWVTSYEAIYKIWIQFGAWRTEEEIVQVVPAVRSVLNGK